MCYSITASGITTTVSKLTAEQTSDTGLSDSLTILKAALSISLSLSIAISVLMYFNAEFAAEYFIKDIRGAAPLRILSLCLPFMAAGSCIKGYFLGRQNNIFPALSQIFEQSVRMISLAAIITVFSPDTIESACSAAIVGVVLGETFSFLLTAAFLFFSTDKNDINKKQHRITLSSSYRKIISMALPLSLSRAASSFLMAVENILIPLRLSLYPKSTDALSQYGNLTGMVMPLVHFPSSVLGAVSVSIIPAVSKQRTYKNKNTAEITVNKSICFTAAVSCCAAVFFYAFSNEICSIIYTMPDLGKILKPLALLCPLMYSQITLNGILNSLGKHFHLFITGIISSLLSIGTIYFLMPLMGISAYIIAAFISTSASVIPSVVISSKYFRIKRAIFKYYFLCSMCAALAAFTAKLIPLDNLFYQMGFMGLIYLLGIIFTGVFSEITGLKMVKKF